MSNMGYYRDYINQQKGRKKAITENIAKLKNDIKDLMRQSKIIEEGSYIIKTVAKQTQEELECDISELVTLALKTVFGDDAYSFIIEFEIKREKTEASFWFVDNYGNKIDPYDASAGGELDVAAFALRIALWAMMPERSDSVFLLDEPFKHLRGKVNQENCSEMIKKISNKLGLQLIVVSDINFSLDADNIIFVQKEDGKTRIKKES